MKIKSFALERYFAQHEFSAKYLMSCSDCEPLKMHDLINMADRESLALWQELNLSYTDSQGHPKLRDEISSLYTDFSYSEITIGAPEECIYLSMNHLLGKGDQIVCTWPAYQSLFQVAESIGCNISYWKPEEDLKFNVDRLESLVTENTKLIIINFPHNPTASFINLEELNRIVEIAAKHDCVLFSDEMYRLLEYNEKDRLPAVCDIYEKGISLSGMSKSYALPGLRIGWLSSKIKGFSEEILKLKDYTTICNSAPSEILALIGIRNKEKIIKRNLNIIQKNIIKVESTLDEFPNYFQWIQPKAGSIAFPKLLHNKPINEIANKLITEKGIMLVPASIYDFEGNYFRIGLGRENFSEVWDIFIEYIIKEFKH